MTLWTPADLATLPTHWWDAEDDATLTLVGSGVSAWANKGSGGGSVGQGTDTLRPQVSTAAFGGRTSISLSSGTAFGTTFSVGAAFRIYAVLNFDAAESRHAILGGTSTALPAADLGSTNTSFGSLNGTAQAGPKEIFQNSVGAMASNRGEVHTAMTGGARVVALRNLPSFASYRLFSAEPNGFRPKGHCGEVLLVPEASVDQDAEDRIHGYLAWRWGLEGSLPVGHPYKSSAPTIGAATATGTLAASESGADTFAASGEVPISGALGASEAGFDTAMIAGQVFVIGTLEAQEAGQDSAALAGMVPISGTLAAQETGSDTFLASGSGPAAISGTLAAQEIGADVAAIAGAVRVAGLLSAEETGADGFSAAGKVLVSGTLDAQENGRDTATIVGGEPAAFVRPTTPVRVLPRRFVARVAERPFIATLAPRPFVVRVTQP